MAHETSLNRKANPGHVRRKVKGEPFVWLSGGAIVTGLVMIAGILLLVVFEGARTFWPRDIELFLVGQSRYQVVEFLDKDGNIVDGPDAPGAIETPIDEDGHFKGLDGKPMDAAGKPAGEKAFVPLTVSRLRQVVERFRGGKLFLKDEHGLVVAPNAKTPVPALDYVAGNVAAAGTLETPFAVVNKEGKSQTLDQIFGDASARDHAAVLGTVRSDRDMDVRDLPRKQDGTPWKSYEISRQPKELLIRQGNQDDGLFQQADYFRWLKLNVPDEDVYRRENGSGFDAYVIGRTTPYGVTEIERLEKGVLTGWVVGVYDRSQPLATLEKDGLDGVWTVWQQKQRDMRDLFNKRYSIEKNDLGVVNSKLKDAERELLSVRYANRESGEMVTAIDRLVDVFAGWTRLEPVSTPTADEKARIAREAYDVAIDAGKQNERRDDHAKKLVEWRAQLNGLLDAWEKEVGAFKLDVTQREALKSARKAEERRGDIQASDYAKLRFEVNELREREKQVTYKLRTHNGMETTQTLAAAVRGFRPNEMGVVGKLGVYFDRVWEFLSADPRESNTEGGIFMAILGTLVMTIVMSILVVPFGVIAALYLREYAKQGWLVSMVRIAVNNLAGVPSIVFGIFGLGMFCVWVGGGIDHAFFPELLPSPTFGGGGLLWASLTLALLTVPVVIVATEEALISVPSSQREASLACGASRFQTIAKVILPQAMPGVLTGLILAMARGAGEVAPLMIVGVVKYAPYPPVDGVSPFLHLERKFMHLGFHIFDVGFQSPNAENTKPLVFSTTLVLIAMVAILNVFAIRIRNRIRSRLQSSHV